MSVLFIDTEAAVSLTNRMAGQGHPSVRINANVKEWAEHGTFVLEYQPSSLKTVFFCWIVDGGIVGFHNIYECLQYSSKTKSRFTSFISIFDRLQVTSVNLSAVSRTPYLHQENIYYQTIFYVSFHWQFVIAYWDLGI